MGLRPEQLQAARLAHVDNSTESIKAITNLVNHLLAGKAPPEVQPYFAGARLCALEKGENDVRPTGAGETVRRLVSKTACNVVKTKTSAISGELQFGGLPVRSERIIHTCRHAMAIHTDNPDFVLCKVDFINAFSNASRTTFLKLVGGHFPELFPWALMKSILQHILGIFPPTSHRLYATGNCVDEELPDWALKRVPHQRDIQ